MPNDLTKTFHISLLDPNGDQIARFEKKSGVSFEFNRKGGCGQCSVLITEEEKYSIAGEPSIEFEDVFDEGSSIEIYINNVKRYSGRLIRISELKQPGSYAYNLLFYGFGILLGQLRVQKTYAGDGIKTIVKDLIDNFVTPYYDITYDEADIDDPGYAISEIPMNHTVQDALALLANIAGNIDWGVDRNRKFFFKNVDPNIRHVYVLGREVTAYQSERQDDNVKNWINFFGKDGLELTVKVTESVDRIGRRQVDLYESSIGVHSDAVRLSSQILKNISTVKRSVKFNFLIDDIFIEETLPLGAAAVNRHEFRQQILYGMHERYGKRFKYGNLKRDQFSSIVYQVVNGGLSISATLQDDVPNLGDLQKRTEFEIKDLQRR